MNYIAVISNSCMSYMRENKNLTSLKKDINQEFGKGWHVCIYECQNEFDEIQAAQGFGKVVSQYKKRA